MQTNMDTNPIINALKSESKALRDNADGLNAKADTLDLAIAALTALEQANAALTGASLPTIDVNEVKQQLDNEIPA